MILWDAEVIGPSTEDDLTPPVAVIKPFPDSKIGDEVEMNGTESYDPGQEDNITKGIIAWEWYIRWVGDDWDEQVMVGNIAVFHYVFDQPGNYVLNLTVTDTSGLTSYIEKTLIISGPVLEVLSIDFYDPSLYDLKEGDTPVISIEFTNSGTVEINTSWKIRITDSGKTIKEATISSLIRPGDILYFNITNYKLKAGERIFEVLLDIDGDLPVDDLCPCENSMEIVVVVEERPTVVEILNDYETRPALWLITCFVLSGAVVFIAIIILFILKFKLVKDRVKE